MTAKTHTTFALALGLSPLVVAPEILQTKLIPLYISGIVFGAIFPDIDEPYSYIGRKIPVLPRVIKYFFGHRGITHQFIFFAIPLVLIFTFQEKIKSIDNGLFIFLVGFSFGMFFHQAGDMLSGGRQFKGGIRDYFFPLAYSGKYFTPFPRIFRCVVGDGKEKLYNLFFTLIVFVELIQIFNKSI